MKTPVLLLVPAACLAGCSLFSSYDPGLDDRFGQLALRTDEVIAEGDAGRLSQAESQTFLRQSLGFVQVVHARAIENHQSAEEVATLTTLEKRYEALLVRNKPLRSSVAGDLKAMLFHLRVRHNYYGFPRTRFETSSDTTSSDDSSATKECKSKSKQGENSKQHDRNDHCDHRNYR